MFYTIAKMALRVYFFFLFRVTVLGKENVPKDGGVLLCANHISNYDPVTVGIYTKRSVRFLAKKELFEKKWTALLMKGLKAFPIDRSTTDMNALKNTIKILKNGEVVGIFAQGTRVKEGEDKGAKSGVALFALKGNVPVVPVRIEGNYKPFSKIKIIYGKPLTLEKYRQKKVRSEELSVIADEIMDTILHLDKEGKEK